MLVVGITGGIGSGKTAVSDRFAARGIVVVDADLASRVVVEAGRPALAAIEEHFGSDVITAQGALDRAALRQRVFADSAERRWLEALLHPLIGDEIRTGLERSTSAYAILVSPLLFESGQVDMVDRVLVVDVPESLQVTRTAARDGNSEDQVRAIMAAQADRATRLARADDVIVNDGSLDDLDRQVEALHQRYLDLASEETRA
ncbi:MAG: dephospho-CoA kinase [Gammaproteobacteria bacterium]|nr:MAG: dephospho-CoA kinase [Gammaproteobacteria bacterium]